MPLSILLLSNNIIFINVNEAQLQHKYSTNTDQQKCLPFGSICDVSIDDQCCIGMACIKTYIYQTQFGLNR